MKTLLLVLFALLLTSSTGSYGTPSDSVFKDTLKKNTTSVKVTAPIINKDELKENLFRKIVSLTFLLTLYIFAVIGMIIRWYFDTRKGIKKNEGTPNKFNLQYWIHDNLQVKIISLFANFLVLFIIFRFTGEIYNFELSMFTAFIIGFCFDFFIDKLRNLSPTTVLESLKK